MIQICLTAKYIIWFMGLKELIKLEMFVVSYKATKIDGTYA